MFLWRYLHWTTSIVDGKHTSQIPLCQSACPRDQPRGARASWHLISFLEMVCLLHLHIRSTLARLYRLSRFNLAMKASTNLHNTRCPIHIHQHPIKMLAMRTTLNARPSFSITFPGRIWLPLMDTKRWAWLRNHFCALRLKMSWPRRCIML